MKRLADLRIEPFITDGWIEMDIIYNKEWILQAVFENAVDGILVADLKTRKFFLCNKSIQKMLGYDEKEIMSLSVDDIHPKGDLPFVMKQFHKQTRGEIAVARNLPVKRKDGSIFYADIGSSMISAGDREFVYGFFRDITRLTDNDESFQDRYHKLEILNNISIEISSSLNSDTVFKKAVALGTHLIGGDGATLAVYDFKNDVMRYPYHYNMPESLTLKVAPKGSGFAELAMNQGSIIVEDYPAQPRALKEFVEAGLQVLIAVPLASRGRNLGALGVFGFAKDKKFTRTDIKILEAVGRQVGVAIENAMLYEKIKNDMAEISRIDKDLKISEEKFRNLVETTSDWIWEIDTDMGYVYASPRIKDLLGFEPQEVIGKTPFDLMPSDEAKRLEPKISEIVKTKSPIISLTNWNRHKKGHLVLLETSGIPLLDESNNLSGYRGIDRDITKRYEAEESLQKSQELYRAVVENANDAIIIIQDGLVVFNNTMAETLTGYSKEERAETSFINFVAPDDRDAILDLYFKKLNGEIFDAPYAFRLTHKDGYEVWGEINAVVISWQGKPALQCFIRDITQRKKMESQLNQAQKMESIGILAGGIAHDFNNLLMAIQGRLSLMMFEMANAGGLSHYQKKIEEVEKDVVRAADLTAKLLGFARKGKIEVHPTDVNNLVTNQTQMFGRTRKEIVIHEDLSKDQLVAEMDHRQIEQVLLNIYINAAQAMPNGGDLYIRTESISLSEKETMQYGELPGVYVKISATDTGVGMDEKVQARIFEPFFTTKEMGHGTGLGLASAFGIIKNHHGFITFHSEKNKGSTFNIYLPASRKSPMKEILSADEIVMGGGTILLVDDEEIVAEVGSELLRILGYKVKVARSGFEALEIYQTNQKEIDLIILDMIMPGMSGDGIFDRLKQINPKAKVLLSSGYSIDGQASAIMTRGCDGFIQKPYSLSVLSRKINDILGIAEK
jgi:two-component system, cell cycle sensor histidine kinase and response regulator CckA